MAAAMLAAPSVEVAAITEKLTDQDIARAFNLANSGDAQRARFHAPYIVQIADPLIEQLEVISEFRRFVLAAEEEIKGGNWVLGRGGYDSKGRSLKDLLRPMTGQVTVRARLRFHPLNNYYVVPPVDIFLGDPTLLPLSATRTPSYAPKSKPGNVLVILGATVDISFNAPTIEDRVLPIRIMMEGTEVARAQVDFSRFE